MYVCTRKSATRLDLFQCTWWYLSRWTLSLGIFFMEATSEDRRFHIVNQYCNLHVKKSAKIVTHRENPMYANLPHIMKGYWHVCEALFFCMLIWSECPYWMWERILQFKANSISFMENSYERLVYSWNFGLMTMAIASYISIW